MASRSQARPVIISALYNFDLYKEKDASMSLEDIISYMVEVDTVKDDIDLEYVTKIISGIQSKEKVLDEIIAKAAPKWTHDMNMMDKAILRTAIYELVFMASEIPPNVVISQAVSMADKFAAPENRRFVNGVLGTVYREMDAEEVSGSKYHTSKDQDGIPIIEKAGGLVFAKHNDNIEIALVHDIWGYWTIPKGKVVNGEKPIETVARKVLEEIGLHAQVLSQLGTNTYERKNAELGTLKNHIDYFLLIAEYGDLKLGTTGGLDDVRWFPIQNLEKLRMYEDITQMLLKAVPIIIKHEF